MREPGTQFESVTEKMSDSIEKTGSVHILASGVAGTLYIGVTSDLVARIAHHRTGIYGGLTRKYSVERLVYYEECGSMAAVSEREKKLKKWRRIWKIQLIEQANFKWADLYPGWYDKNL